MNIKQLSAITAVVSVLGIGVAAQQQGTNAQAQADEHQPGDQMSMEDMMKGCREHCETALKSTEALTKAMAGAKSANDPARMRAALSQAEKPLADMRQHMKTCMNMMTMMQKMHGSGANR